MRFWVGMIVLALSIECALSRRSRDIQRIRKRIGGGYARPELPSNPDYTPGTNEYTTQTQSGVSWDDNYGPTVGPTSTDYGSRTSGGSSQEHHGGGGHQGGGGHHSGGGGSHHSGGGGGGHNSGGGGSHHSGGGESHHSGGGGGHHSGGGNDGDDHSVWRLEDAIPGKPESDYPTFTTIPQTSFDCKQQQYPGYYADPEARCQVFHICQDGGRQNAFLCPVGTLFNQKLFTCDWWQNVDCNSQTNYYQLNADLYKEPEGGRQHHQAAAPGPAPPATRTHATTPTDYGTDYTPASRTDYDSPSPGPPASTDYGNTRDYHHDPPAPPPTRAPTTGRRRGGGGYSNPNNFDKSASSSLTRVWYLRHHGSKKK